MTLRDKIVNVVENCGCRPLSYRAQDALVELFEREFEERLRNMLRRSHSIPPSLTRCRTGWKSK